MNARKQVGFVATLLEELTKAVTDPTADEGDIAYSIESCARRIVRLTNSSDVSVAIGACDD